MIFVSRFMLCQVDKMETDMRLNPTVRSYGKKSCFIILCPLGYLSENQKEKNYNNNTHGSWLEV